MCIQMQNMLCKDEMASNLVVIKYGLDSLLPE